VEWKELYFGVRAGFTCSPHHLLAGKLNYIYFGVSHLIGKPTEHEDENIPIRLANVKKFNTSMCKNMGSKGSSI